MDDEPQDAMADERDAGRPAAEHRSHVPVVVWDNYHGFVVGRRDPLTGLWKTDLPYAFEFGGKELELDPVRFWPLPAVPGKADRRQRASAAEEAVFTSMAGLMTTAMVEAIAEAMARSDGGDPVGPVWPGDWLPNEVEGYRRLARVAVDTLDSSASRPPAA